MKMEEIERYLNEGSNKRQHKKRMTITGIYCPTVYY
jgi:hypothetical protein